MRTRIRIILITAAALTTVGVLAGCSAGGMSNMPGMGGGMSQPGNSSAPHNDADVMFAQMMIPHHQQAIEMADVLLGKPGIDPKVTALAQQIKDAQGPEITSMQAWLTRWGAPTAAATDGMNMGGGMSDSDMQALDAAAGVDAAKLFLTQMITHHQGAIAMADDEVKNGSEADVKAMAQKIIDGQTAEIATMQQLLATL